MTSAEMLARIGVLVDETPGSSTFYTIDDAYRFLTSGQYEVANYFLNLYRKMREVKRNVMLPFALQTLLKSKTATLAETADTIQFPTDYWEYVSLMYSHTSGDRYPVRIRPHNDLQNFFKENSFAGQNTDAHDYYANIIEDFGGFQMSGESSSGSSYRLNYIKKPTDIRASVQPVLGANTHDAIVIYAAAMLMIKDERWQESNALMQVFITKLSQIEVFGNVNP